MTEEEKRKQEKDATQTAIEGLNRRASELRDYAASPVTIDKSGQHDWMSEIERVRNEYIEAPEQKAARERRESRNRKLAALADGLVALSNITGAMAGATPVQQTSLSAAHRKAVEDAAAKRRQNYRYYDTARRYYSGLQYKQDKDNAKRYSDELKARRDAGKQADTLDYKAANLGLTKQRNIDSQKNKDRDYEEKVRHNRQTEAQGNQRIAISQQRANKGGSSGSNYQADWDEYASWERAYPDEVNEIKEDNAQTDPWTHLPSKSVTSSTVRLVNAKMRQKYGSPGGGGSGKGSGGSSALRNRGKGSALKNRN